MSISIAESLLSAQGRLQSSSESARLDAEVLLAHVIEKSRTYLHTWPEHLITDEQLTHYQQVIQRRAQGEPVAYLTGRQEFWSLSLKVTPATLIPRPETELLVEKALEKIPVHGRLHVLDLGTGSGAIALAIAKERTMCHVVAVDMSAEALEVAAHNANEHSIQNVEFLQSDWFSKLVLPKFDLILANPPYICDDDPHLYQDSIRFEPVTALTAGTDGLHDLRLIINQAKPYLTQQGWLLVEHGYDQATAVQALLIAAGYHEIADFNDYAGQARLAMGTL